MKVVILAAQNSIHTVRWVNSLSERGYKVYLVTQHELNKNIISESVVTYHLPFRGLLGYFLNISFLKSFLDKVKPDILHAHYAGGYGVMGYLSQFHPFVLSVWGSDVYKVPYISPLHKILITNTLRYADWICSTSYVMARQVFSLCPELDQDKVTITPFGIDLEKFITHPKTRSKDIITIGTIKTLELKYGVDILIKSFQEVLLQLEKSSSSMASTIQLVIVGDGSLKNELQNLVTSLGLEKYTKFIGSVPHYRVPKYLSMLDVYVAVSRDESESFGVAVLEASACELPVVVSNVGGLPEVVVDKKTGIVVEKENVEATAEAIMKLIIDPHLREQIGKAGRQHVVDNYDWHQSVDIMEEVYKKASL